MGSPTMFSLRLRGNDIWLATGEYVIGRSVSCHVVLDDSLVSRRHARLSVAATRATIVDLGSVNGTFVNGERVLDGPRVLAGGEAITIGNHTLEFQRGERPPSRGATAETRGGDAAAASVEGKEEEDPTARSDGLAIAGLGADSAIAAGRPADAERFLGGYLANVLSEVRAGRNLPPSTIQEAVKQSLRLAEETRKGAWLDYAVSLLRAARSLPSDEAIVKLRLLTPSLPVDLTGLQQYHAELVRNRASMGLRDQRVTEWIAELCAQASARPPR